MIGLSSKRGVEAQFNWILVLIGGFFLFMLLVMSAMTGLQANLAKQQIEQLAKLDEALSTIRMVDSLSLTLRVPQDLRTTCVESNGEVVESSLILEGAVRSIETVPLFSPARLEDTRLVVQTQRIFSPYYVDTAVYFFEESTKYIVISDNDPDFIQKVTDLLPEDASIEPIEFSELEGMQDTGHKRYVLIGKDTFAENLNFGSGGNAPPWLLKKPFGYIKLDTALSGAGVSAGEIFFAKKNPSSPSQFGFDTPVTVRSLDELKGAFASADEKLFKCTLTKISSMQETVKQGLIERIEKLKARYGTSLTCPTILGNVNVDNFVSLVTTNNLLASMSCMLLY